MLTSLKCRVFASSILICLWASLSQSLLSGLQTPPCDMLTFLQIISIISFRIVVWLITDSSNTTWITCKFSTQNISFTI
ncbi:hypothetical protein HanHA300_Chr08g0280961 [Helianthus annuus]|nr:hypothetical protein HanHA300_Chr08g0280961 [Helianthus annuus]KAJ0553740.1 hypothetical protein HanHA89_Chr08g0299791 [Helianthus annuus]KAJ0719400.1 hypothetical protein HanLR1_Chr08g0281341 [Helianthus annuus]